MTVEADAFRGTGPSLDDVAAVPGNGHRRWHVAAVAVAGLVALPVLAIAWTALFPTENIWPHLASTVLPGYVLTSLLLMAGVGLGTFVIGTGTAGITRLSHLLAWLPNGCKVTSISDPKVPILGIGESTTTTIPESLYYGADFNMIQDGKELEASVKHGVRYVNWRENEFYTVIPPAFYAIILRVFLLLFTLHLNASILIQSLS